MTKASAIKCEWSKPCYEAAKLHLIVLDDRKINLNLCDVHWTRLRMGDFDPVWFGELLAQLLHGN